MYYHNSQKQTLLFIQIIIFSESDFGLFLISDKFAAIIINVATN